MTCKFHRFLRMRIIALLFLYAVLFVSFSDKKKKPYTIPLNGRSRQKIKAYTIGFAVMIRLICFS